MLDPIPGDPEALAAAASVFGAGGGALEAVVGRVSMTSEVGLAGWRGTAARAFRVNWATTRQGLVHGAEACREIGTVLNRLSTQLADAQDTLRRASSMVAAGDETDALRVEAEAEEMARQAFTAAGGAFARIEAAARTLRSGMAAAQPAPSILVTPLGQPLAWKEVLPIVSVGPFVQVTPVLGDGLWREFLPIAPPTNQPLTSGSAGNPRDILMPGGKPIGSRGSDPGIRVLKGGFNEAEELFKKLTQGGVPHTRTTYPGHGVTLPTGGWIGFRISTRSGPVIDVNLPTVPELKKLHFS